MEPSTPPELKPADTSAPLLHTPEEAAAVLRIGRTRLYALLADGTISSVQIGHSRRITVWALEDYVRRLEGRAAKTTVTPERHDWDDRVPHRSRRPRRAESPGSQLLPLPSHET